MSTDGTAATTAGTNDEARFKEWMAKVDANISKRVGLSLNDLPDICYRDLFEDGASPSTAAGDAIRNAKGGF